MKTRELTITPKALMLFKQVLLTEDDIDKRLRIETELGLELDLATWEFFYGRNRWPVKYKDDAALSGQLERVLDTVVNRHRPP